MPRAIKILTIYTFLKCVKLYPEVNDINFSNWRIIPGDRNSVLQEPIKFSICLLNFKVRGADWNVFK